MLTLDQARDLKFGEILVDNYGKRWKVNGQVQTWKTRPWEIRVPLKHGLYNYSALTDGDFDSNGECNTLTRESEVVNNADCFVCGGDGWLPSLPEGKSQCPYCKGTGKREYKSTG